MTTPCILITSCGDLESEELVKDILKTDTLPDVKEVIESIQGYDWHISTKYYTADVLLCTAKERTIGDRSFAESVEAFIAYFTADQENSFELAKAWLPYLEQIEPEIKMLVCDKCTENHKVNRLQAQTWCIDNDFELVELNPETDSDSDMEDDFLETTGVSRIVQALQAHTWSNLKMRENPVHHSPYFRQLMQEEYESKNVHSSAGSCDKKTDSKNSVEKLEQSSDSITESENLTANSDIKTDVVKMINNKSCDVENDKQLVDNDKQLADNDKQLADNDKQLADNDKQLADNDKQLADNNKQLADNDKQLADNDKQLADNDKQLADNDKQLADNDKQLNENPDCTGDAGVTGASTNIPKSSEAKHKEKKAKQPSKEERLDSLLQASDMSLFESLGDEDPGGESFEKMFERFGRMKERARNLPPEERKKYAEEVAVAFWRAIGGPEDEIENLSDSD